MDRPSPLKIDIGCGKNKKEGFWGVDKIKFDPVDEVLDIKDRWPFEDSSVDEAHCSHTLEHLLPLERIHFANELWRVLKPDAQCVIITPHWASQRAYGDMAHQWPPVSEFWYYYLNKVWRGANAPHLDIEFNKDGYTCNFDTVTSVYTIHPVLIPRNIEYQTNALTWYKEAATDLINTIVKKV